MQSGLIRVWATALALTIALLFATGATAHAQLLSSTPAQNATVESAPPMAQLAFNEPVTALVVTLIAPDGSRQDLLGNTTSGQAVTVALPSGLATGTHVLSWRAVSVDAHPIGGSLIFSVGAPGGSGAAGISGGDPLVATGLWITKATMLVGLLFGAGGALFGLFAEVPPRARTLARILLVAGLIAAPLSLGLHGLDALGLELGGILSPQAWSTALRTSYGATSLAAEAALVLGIVALSGARLRAAGWLSWLLGAMALSLSGHASAADPQWITRPMVFLHLSGLMFWIGALAPLLAHLHARSAAADAALSAFSGVIPLAVAPVVISGVALAVVQLGAPGPQWLAPYALILAAKLVLLVALFTLALWNRNWLTRPALAGEPVARRRLALSVRAEIVLVLLILGLVGAWRFTPPPRALAEVAVAGRTEPLLLHLMNDEDMAMVVVDPGRAGIVALDISLSDIEGNPIAAQGMVVTLSSPALGIEPFKVPAAEIDGSWRIEALQLPAAGTWILALEVRKSRFSQTTLTTEFEIR